MRSDALLYLVERWLMQRMQDCDCLTDQSGFPLPFLLQSTVICSHRNLRKKIAAAAVQIWQSLLAELASPNQEVIVSKCISIYILYDTCGTVQYMHIVAQHGYFEDYVAFTVVVFASQRT